MTALRSFIELIACVITGLVAGALLLITWYGLEPTLELAHHLLLYVYGGLPLSP